MYSHVPIQEYSDVFRCIPMYSMYSDVLDVGYYDGYIYIYIYIYILRCYLSSLRNTYVLAVRYVVMGQIKNQDCFWVLFIYK